MFENRVICCIDELTSSLYIPHEGSGVLREVADDTGATLVICHTNEGSDSVPIADDTEATLVICRMRLG
ncbi:hypothetical protein AR158_C002L [Paramecium bursaria Chlorella virus AR158]|uniref:hypothetical protein n=1 Tax=Paramecium bursaria Chlorella virus AR158 TaxID=380598 RepID=UPI00015AA6F1|nr:hypothetical protein AR158_C002L [Paramecium bursaria Chlorella virus AR158]ABU43548.1 hypothetical protein AR158_C002L [Paramecium bursaria Chlorella virus AR158]